MLFAVFAQASPPTWAPASAEMAGLYVLVGLVFLAQAVDAVGRVWDRFFPKVTFQEDLRKLAEKCDDTYETKEDASARETRIFAELSKQDIVLSGQDSKLDNIRTILTTGLQSLSRDLGRVEGKVEK